MSIEITIRDAAVYTVSLSEVLFKRYGKIHKKASVVESFFQLMQKAYMRNITNKELYGRCFPVNFELAPSFNNNNWLEK